jgi:hypothetical protein
LVFAVLLLLVASALVCLALRLLVSGRGTGANDGGVGTLHLLKHSSTSNSFCAPISPGRVQQGKISLPDHTKLDMLCAPASKDMLCSLFATFLFRLRPRFVFVFSTSFTGSNDTLHAPFVLTTRPWPGSGMTE